MTLNFAWDNTTHLKMISSKPPLPRHSLVPKMPKRSQKNWVSKHSFVLINDLGGVGAPGTSVDLTAALEYYGSEKARVDFLNNREEPTELIGKQKGDKKGAAGIAAL